MLFRRIIALVSFIVLGGLIALRAQDNLDDTLLDLERIQRATVFIMQADAENLNTYCIGSGTIVRYDGLILTNAHHTVPSTECPGEELIIAMTIDPTQPPIPKYRAEIVQVNEGADLALLRINRELDGREVDSETLPILPFVEVVDAGSVELDDTLTLVGYPNFENDPVTTYVTTAAAFLSEPSGGSRSWIKVASTSPIPGLISGGGAYNQEGQLVAIPTSAPLDADQAIECRLLDDTNGDGFINRNDSCIPIGEPISVLRPTSFARPLIRSASLGLQINSITVPQFQAAATESPIVSREFFATSINNGIPNRVVGSVPTGATSLYFFFDYQNFTPQTVYEVQVSIDGVPNQTFSLPPVRFSGGTNGIWYVGSSDQPWPNGTYEFRLFVDGVAVVSRLITIGGTPQDAPEFSNVAFGLLDEQGNLQGESYVLPAGDIASARFVYRNMQPGLSWTSRWYYNGIPISEPPVDVWTADDGVNGSRTDVSIRPDGGLRPGNYRVELYLQEADTLRLKTTGDFVVAGEQAGALPVVFTNLEFLRSDSPTTLPEGSPSTNFPDGANTLFARFDWQQIAPGTRWTQQWLVDGRVFYEETSLWNTTESGEDYTLRLTAPGGLPDATYTLNLLVNGVLLASEEASVGIGQLPIDRLEQVGGTRLGGQIIDAETGIGVPGATFVLISEDFSVADFVWDQEQIYGLAVTDEDGNFEIDRPIQLDAPYSVYVLAEGYLPVTGDGYIIDAEILAEQDGGPIEMIVSLTRD